MILFYELCTELSNNCRLFLSIFDDVIKQPESVHNARIFANSSLNETFRNGLIPKCEKFIAPNQDGVPTCILGDPAYPTLTFLKKIKATQMVVKLLTSIFLVFVFIISDNGD